MDLLLHVGLHKTATTTAQACLGKNSQALKEHGILYPSTGLWDSQHALIPGCLIPAYQVLNHVDPFDQLQHYLSNLQVELDQVRPSLVVISSEVFTEIIGDKKACLRLIQALSQPFARVTLLLSLRDPRAKALSGLKHLLRDHFAESGVKAGNVFVNPVTFFFEIISQHEQAIRFWHASEMPVHERYMEGVAGSVVDHYFGDIFDEYSSHARQLLRPETNPAIGPSLRLNSDELISAAYLVLFMLGNSMDSEILMTANVLVVINEELQAATSFSDLSERLNDNQLLGYFDYFATRDLRPKHILISEKLNALTHAGLTLAEILDIFTVVHRVKLRLAIS